MPARHVCLSDLHLGYEKSVLNDPAAQDHLIDQIAKLCGGSTDRLILNGDCFEGCVPIGAGDHDVAGFNPRMAEISRSFLQKFTDKILATSLVILWGNHDYCLWQNKNWPASTPVAPPKAPPSPTTIVVSGAKEIKVNGKDVKPGTPTTIVATAASSITVHGKEI
jgi:hypothetical protein